MGKIEKKRVKLIERIKELETNLNLSLTKKTSSSVEVDVGLQQRKILELKQQLKTL